MKRILSTLLLVLMVCSICLSAVSCDVINGIIGGDTTDNGGDNTGDGGNGGNNGDETPSGSPIASLTATETSTTMKVGDMITLTNFYDIKGTSSLSAAQRACTYESSNPEVVSITAKKAEAVAPGTATITITSKADPTKSCSFEVTVERVFIDREISMIPSEDDFSNEWNEETQTGSFRTSSGITNFYYIDDIYSTQWYVETEITLHSVNWDDRWPKVGIITTNKDADGNESMVAFFLNASIGLKDYYDDNGNLVHGEDNLNWNEFGVCEVQNKHWAWEPDITNYDARHHDYAWNTGETKITFGDTFKLGVARDGANFHVYVNDNYMGSFQLSSELKVLYENGEPAPCHVGFYQFASDVTFSNYSATTDSAKIAEKIPAEPIYCEFLED